MDDNESVNPESREVRADARDVRQDARDVRADVKDTELQAKEGRSEIREDVVTEREGSVTGSIRLLKWLVVVLIIISFGNFIRTFYNQDSTDKAATAADAATEVANQLQDVASEGRDASVETLQELREILRSIEEQREGQPQLTNQAIIEALQTIARLEAFLCNGRCPDPAPQEAPG